MDVRVARPLTQAPQGVKRLNTQLTHFSQSSEAPSPAPPRGHARPAPPASRRAAPPAAASSRTGGRRRRAPHVRPSPCLCTRRRWLAVLRATTLLARWRDRAGRAGRVPSRTPTCGHARFTARAEGCEGRVGRSSLRRVCGGSDEKRREHSLLRDGHASRPAEVEEVAGGGPKEARVVRERGGGGGKRGGGVGRRLARERGRSRRRRRLQRRFREGSEKKVPRLCCSVWLGGRGGGKLCARVRFGGVVDQEVCPQDSLSLSLSEDGVSRGEVGGLRRGAGTPEVDLEAAVAAATVAVAVGGGGGWWRGRCRRPPARRRRSAAAAASPLLAGQGLRQSSGR